MTDEKSGILYTCRGGFIDIAHVRDNADRTLYLAAQIGRLPATGGIVPLVDEGAVRRIAVRPESAEDVLARLVYFSFTTLTTVGYGDISAVHPVARSAAILEALVGQLFPAILIARLVGLSIRDPS